MGIIKGLDHQEYLQVAGVSNSMLNALMRSPAHLKHYIENGSKEPTYSMQFGTALHMALLEPCKFQERYIAIPENMDLRTKEGKQFKEACEFGMLTILKNEDYKAIQSIQEKCRNHSTIPALLENVEAEISLFWEDEETKIPCKGRCDGWVETEELKLIIDIKTTTNARVGAFEKSIFKYGYHRQGALYLDGAKALGKDFRHYLIIAIENEPPYNLAVYRLLDEIVELGRKEVKKLLAQYDECLKADEWAGYPEGVQDIAIPSWALNKLEEEYYE
mgnify:CR=1 FL=1